MPSSPTVKFAEPSRYDTFSDGEYSETSYERRSRGRSTRPSGSKQGKGKGKAAPKDQTMYYVLYGLLGLAVLALIVAVIGVATNGFGLMESEKQVAERKEAADKEAQRKRDASEPMMPADPSKRDGYKRKSFFDPNPKYNSHPMIARFFWFILIGGAITATVLAVGYSSANPEGGWSGDNNPTDAV